MNTAASDFHNRQAAATRRPIGPAPSLGLLLAVAVAVASAAAAMAQPTSASRMKVAVSILPQAYFVERIGGEQVEVSVLVGPGQSPHAYEPTPKQIADLSAAKVYFAIGVEFEKAVLPRIRSMFPDLRIVDMRDGVRLRKMETACRHEHEHEHQHEAGPDPHIWLSPRLAKTQARTIHDALCELDQPNADHYRRNLALFDADLGRVHARIGEVLRPLKGREVFVFHPAFGYFTDEFNLTQVPVEIEGKQPTARQLADLIERAKAGGVKVIFVEPQFSRKSAEAVAEAIGAAVVAIDPLARDYLENLEEMAENIKAGVLTTETQRHREEREN